MELSQDKIQEAKEILCKGKEHCFDPADYDWAIRVIKQAFSEGYDIVKVW